MNFKQNGAGAAGTATNAKTSTLRRTFYQRGHSLGNEILRTERLALLPDSMRILSEGVLGLVEWFAPQRGYCRCPGIALHTGINGRRDCRVTLDGVPTVYCVHSSCRTEIERINHALRSIIGSANANGGKRPCQRSRTSVEEKHRQREREAQERLKLHAESSLATILSEYTTTPADLFEESPVRLLDDPADDWRLLLQLFQSGDVVWIGDKFDSGNGHEQNFRRVSEWLTTPAAPASLICPNTFKPGVNSRSNENVLHHRFLVVESDTLSKAQIVSVLSWCREFLRLRAVVDTAGKSLHGWFDYPTAAQFQELKSILPALSCDPALFKPSQPCRLPGARRGERTQTLLWLDLDECDDA